MLKKLLQIERINAWTFSISSWSLLGMTLFVSYEVIARYVFNRPTIWAWDVNVQLMLVLLLMGIAENYRRNVHVRVDVITGLLTPRQNAWINVFMAPVFFLVTVVLLITCWLYFLDSYQRMETASTLFAPPLYPVKFLMPLASALLLLQGAANLVRDLRIALGRDGQTPGSES